MKFPISNFQFPVFRRSGKVPARSGVGCNHWPSAAVHRKFSQGVALVITLIMLSVTLVMAVAFLAVARRDRNAVTTTTEITTARLADDAALAAAQAQIVANVLNANAAAYNFGPLVSTNYINPAGYNSAAGANLTNVNYDYTSDNSTYNANDFIQNIANLLLLPRAPVFIVTNTATQQRDFRYFLDLNRNGKFEGNGNQPQFGNSGSYLHNDGTEGNSPADVVTNFMAGDPEWIGVLERPDQPHGPDNPFIARYAFRAQPIGNSLDLNAIHNQVFYQSLSASDGFYRNQGVGSWELNFAAFLADLNTNLWGAAIGAPSLYYQYNLPLTGFANSGYAFEDARALLAYRYNFNYNNLASANFSLLNANTVFPNDRIDGYSDGPLQTTVNFNADSVADVPTRSWAGADNPNRFFSLPADLFDTTKVPAAFANRLLNAGNAVDTYDRYTFYRLLDQLGTDSSADAGKMNLNYKNIDNYGNVVAGMETNQFPWTALGFFTNAADRLLRYHTAQWNAQNHGDFTNTFGAVTTGSFGVGNIPVYIDGRFVYSPAVNRLLQLAANLYDASTNTFYPSVFRPTFYKVGGDVYINGYVDISTANTIAIGIPPLDAPVTDLGNSALVENASVNALHGNVYGVPWIIGAKKGFPNFNQYFMRNTVQVTRKLQVTRANGLVPGATGTNQMFVMSITNRLGFSFWNSYNSNYVGSGRITVYVRDIVNMALTDGSGTPAFLGGTGSNPSTVLPLEYTNILNTWPGSSWTTSGTTAPENQSPASQSFVSAYWDFAFLPESTFQAALNNFMFRGDWGAVTTPVPVFPQFDLLTTNHLQAFILDGDKVIDYVQLSGPNGARNISDEIADRTDNSTENNQMIAGTSMWDTNGYNSVVAPTKGVANQIKVSKNNPSGTITAFWKAPANMPPGFNGPAAEAAYFNGFFVPNYVYNGKVYVNTNPIVQAPYTPTRTAWQYTTWQANDPLVHYIYSDLNTSTRLTGVHHADDVTTSDYPKPDLNTVSERYQPWGRNAQMSQVTGSTVDASKFNLGYRDPLVWGSDYWNFPADRYPTVGWIGRVHRGTPWQTVSLKSANILDATGLFAGNPVNVGHNSWTNWTGDTQTSFDRTFDADNSAPIHDSDLFDLFTTRFNDNAVRGTLSVNQTNLAAWSALFSGLIVLSNATDFPVSSSALVFTNIVIDPAGGAGSASPIGQIVAGINATRARMNRGPNGTFTHVGDILRTPEFTEHSPFLNWNDSDQQKYGISDELYEWLPQQTLGLLRVSNSPRYVVYTYGQTLKPAPDGKVLSGAFFGMVTNYQVTAESAARAVIRVDRVGTQYKTTLESYNVLPPN